MKATKTNSGFTLIEVLMVVAIIAIIASIAYPSYMDSVRRSNRSDAQTEMMDLAQRLQRCYTAHASFNDAANCAVFTDINDDGYVTREGFYRITFAAGTVSATTYTLAATAIAGPQIGDTDCDTEMTLAHTGARAPAACW